MDHGAVLRTAAPAEGGKIVAVRIELTLFWLWARWLSICLRCDKAIHPPDFVLRTAAILGAALLPSAGPWME